MNLNLTTQDLENWSELNRTVRITSPILAYYGTNFRDFTTWSPAFDVIKSALKNPYVLGLMAISLFNTINDPTTKGLSDSQRALKYIKPN